MKADKQCFSCENVGKTYKFGDFDVCEECLEDLNNAQRIEDSEFWNNVINKLGSVYETKI